MISKSEEEAARVLEPEGRSAISDSAVPPDGRATPDRTDPDQTASCIAGAATVGELHGIAADSGFELVTVRETERGVDVIRNVVDESDLLDPLLAATIEGRKPMR